MKVTGFTIIRNALKFDYPIREAILSVLPLCDEFIVAVGNSSDGTLEFIQSISPKLTIIETIWDDTLRQGGKVLADETNKAFAQISKDSDWCFYIQGDEVIHEKDYPAIRKAMQEFQFEKNVDGLLFKYLHFYGSYNFIADSLKWYRFEARIIRQDAAIFSYGDAMGFRKGKNEKLNVKEIDATVYHYGWVREPAKMQAKTEQFHTMWHADDWVEKNVIKASEYDYSVIDSLQKFEGQHPQVMHARIAKKNWDFNFNFNQKKMNWKYFFRKQVEQIFGIDLGFKNWKKV